MKNLIGSNPINTSSVFITLIGIVITMPIFFIVIESFSLDLSLTNFHNSIKRYISETTKLVFYTAIITLLLAVPAAWVVTHYKLKFKTIIDLLLVLPLSIPCYIMAFTYADLLGFNGYVDVFFRNILNARLTFDVITIEWLSIFLALALYPYVYTTSRISFSLTGTTYLNLAKSLGMPSLIRIFKVGLPLSISGIFSGLLLVVMEILNEYGAVNYFGIETFSVGIFKYWFSMDNKGLAILFSLFLLLIIFAILRISAHLENKNKKFTYHIKSSSLISKHVTSSAQRIFHYLIIFIPITFGLFVPLIFIINNVRKHINEYNWHEWITITGNSLNVALLSSLIIVVVALFILLIKRKNENRWIKMIINFVSTGYAIPGAVIGLSFMLIIQNLGSSYSILMGTLSLLIYAYVFRFIAVSIFPLEANFQRQPKEFDQLGRSLGLNSFEVFKKINLPLSKLAILTSFLLVFIDVLKELPLTLILRPFNFDTLATQAYQHASEEMLSYSSIYSLGIIFFCTLVIVFIKLILKK